MSDRQLVLTSVVKEFGGVRALDGIDLTVAEGELLGLIGPNGSGKTTLINLVSGLLCPSSGSIVYGGNRLDGLPAHRVARLGIGRTFQLLRGLPTLSVYENVLAGAHLYGRGGLIAAVFGKLVIGSEERRLSDRAYEMIRFVGLGDRANVPASELPAGQGRLLELARALAPNPDLLLLDEPASGLTSSERATLERKLRELQMSGKTIILVDHDMRLVMNLADRVVVLNEGRVLAGGTPSDVQASPSVIDVYLGRRRANPRNAVATDRTGGQS